MWLCVWFCCLVKVTNPALSIAVLFDSLDTAWPTRTARFVVTLVGAVGASGLPRRRAVFVRLWPHGEIAPETRLLVLVGITMQSMLPLRRIACLMACLVRACASLVWPLPPSTARSSMAGRFFAGAGGCLPKWHGVGGFAESSIHSAPGCAGACWCWKLFFIGQTTSVFL